MKSRLGEDQSAYWSKTTANPYEANAGLELAIDQLIEQGRPYAAIRCLDRMLHEEQPFDNRKAVRALTEAFNSSESPHSMDVYEIIEIIKALQKDRNTHPDDLFQVEWAYLPLLVKDHDASPKLLSRRLAEDPRFFCEVIRLVFRSKKEERLSEEATEERKNLAAHAYGLLSEWRIPPGLGEDGTYDGNALKGWLDAVKKECTETGHLEIAMTQVGHVLIHVPADPDGLWLHHSAAEVLNVKDAQDMRVGFQTELYNSRGGHWVDPTGKPEKELAAGYRTQAEAVENAGITGWPPRSENWRHHTSVKPRGCRQEIHSMSSWKELSCNWSDEDQVFVAEIPELPGCMAHGDTQEAALANAKEAIQLWVETAE